jgi:hypothetical protein
MSLFEYFSACGEVTDVKLVLDQRTGKSKGLAYIEFANADCVAIALALTGQDLAGFPITVSSCITDRRPVAKPYGARICCVFIVPLLLRILQTHAYLSPYIHNYIHKFVFSCCRSHDFHLHSAAAASEGRFKVLVSNLDAGLTEADLRPVFAAFGDVAHLDIARGGTVGEKGAVTVQYKKRADALGAVQVSIALYFCSGDILSLSLASFLVVFCWSWHNCMGVSHTSSFFILFFFYMYLGVCALSFPTGSERL